MLSCRVNPRFWFRQLRSPGYAKFGYESLDNYAVVDDTAAWLPRLKFGLSSSQIQVTENAVPVTSHERSDHRNAKRRERRANRSEADVAHDQARRSEYHGNVGIPVQERKRNGVP